MNQEAMNMTGCPRGIILSAWSFTIRTSTSPLRLRSLKLLSQEGLSESEIVFFGGVKKFKKNYLKLLDRRRIG